MPATRDLARHYGLARGTIVAAFAQLKAEGYLEAAVGSGTYVARVLPDRLLEVGRKDRGRAGAATAEPPAGERSRPRRLSGYGRRTRPDDYLDAGPVRAFRANQPALYLIGTVEAHSLVWLRKSR